MQVVMVQFLSIIFFSWISSIFVGFFKSSHFFVSPCILRQQAHLLHILRHNAQSLFYFLPNAVYCIILSYSVQINTQVFHEPRAKI